MRLEEIKTDYEMEKNHGMGSDIKDSFHTMSELYFNRMVMFTYIVNSNKDKAWKSKLHDDGTGFEGFFLVVVDTPAGQFGYHYQDKYWDYFNCQELERGKPYDGFEPNDIGRLFSLLEGGE